MTLTEFRNERASSRRRERAQKDEQPMNEKGMERALSLTAGDRLAVVMSPHEPPGSLCLLNVLVDSVPKESSQLSTWAHILRCSP